MTPPRDSPADAIRSRPWAPDGDGDLTDYPGGAQHAAYYLTDGVQTSALDTVLRQTAHLLGFPTGSVIIANATTLHTLAHTGPAQESVSSRAQMPCDHVISSGCPVAIADLAPLPAPALGDPYHRTAASMRDASMADSSTMDARSSVTAAANAAAAAAGWDYPLLAATGVRAYVGVPLRGREGTVVGSLCLTDTEPHAVTAAQTALLQTQAEIVEDHLDLHRRRSDLHLPTTEDGSGPTPGSGPLTTPGGAPHQGVPPGDEAHRPAFMMAAVADLRRGLAAGEVVAYYEPILDGATGQVEALEALARWQHPRRGLLAPAAFIPLAEDSDLIIDLDLVVLAQAVEQLRQWQFGRPDLRVNVNLSGRHLAHLECVQRIHDVVTRAGVAPSSVGLEITESALIALTPQAISFVERLRALGFVILFDDFGTGWASLSYLLHLPADAVKIDRSFTAALSTPAGTALVRALLTMARELGLDTIVEGVATAVDAARTQALGCRLVQGHHYSPAVPADQVPW